MYPFDFISSNVHAIYEEFENTNNPIITISFEHLLAIILDTVEDDKCIFDYWKKRKQDMSKYSKLKFDNNELDLYYELFNDNTMLSRIKTSGLLDMVSNHAQIISTFRDENGNEIRPSHKMIKELDIFLISGIFKNGKNWFGINKRYLKNLQNYFIIK